MFRYLDACHPNYTWQVLLSAGLGLLSQLNCLAQKYPPICLHHPGLGMTMQISPHPAFTGVLGAEFGVLVNVKQYPQAVVSLDDS